MWWTWLKRFNTYLLAEDIKDNARERALLLYQAGPKVYKIFKTLTEQGEDKYFEAAVNTLTTYFEQEKNIIYHLHAISFILQATQGQEDQRKRLKNLLHIHFRMLAG